jgi:hypothetical protein
MTERNAGLIALIVGIIIVLAAVTADPTGLGGQPGFGWRQMAATALGIIVAIIGVILYGLPGLSGHPNHPGCSSSG